MDVTTLNSIPPWEWPESAATAILRVVNDDNAKESDRLLAVELASSITILNEEIADALLAIVRSGDEAEELRGTAAISLGPALEYADMMEFEDDEEDLLSEEAFSRIRESLRDLFFDTHLPRDVRRRILEASVRAPQDWHEEAVRTAYSSDDDAWQLTAVFCMRFIRGFEKQILEALDCEDPEVHYEAVCAAGNWEVDAAWSHIAELATADHTDKELRIAAIEAVATIRPQDAAEILCDLVDSRDGDIAEAVEDALTTARGILQFDNHDDDNDHEYPL